MLRRTERTLVALVALVLVGAGVYVGVTAPPIRSTPSQMVVYQPSGDNGYHNEGTRWHIAIVDQFGAHEGYSYAIKHSSKPVFSTPLAPGTYMMEAQQECSGRCEKQAACKATVTIRPSSTAFMAVYRTATDGCGISQQVPL